MITVSVRWLLDDAPALLKKLGSSPSPPTLPVNPARMRAVTPPEVAE
jgi:hypothetical protein